MNKENDEQQDRRKKLEEYLKQKKQKQAAKATTKGSATTAKSTSIPTKTSMKGLKKPTTKTIPLTTKNNINTTKPSQIKVTKIASTDDKNSLKSQLISLEGQTRNSRKTLKTEAIEQSFKAVESHLNDLKVLKTEVSESLADIKLESHVKHEVDPITPVTTRSQIPRNSPLNPFAVGITDCTPIKQTAHTPLSPTMVKVESPIKSEHTNGADIDIFSSISSPMLQETPSSNAKFLENDTPDMSFSETPNPGHSMFSSPPARSDFFNATHSVSPVESPEQSNPDFHSVHSRFEDVPTPRRHPQKHYPKTPSNLKDSIRFSESPADSPIFGYSVNRSPQVIQDKQQSYLGDLIKSSRLDWYKLGAINIQTEKLARFMYKSLAELDLDQNRSYLYVQNGAYKVLKIPFKRDLKFWLSWARYEEEWGNLLDTADIFFLASDSIQSKEDQALLTIAFEEFQNRMKDRFISLQDEDLADLSSPLPPQLQSDLEGFFDIKEPEAATTIPSEDIDDMIGLMDNLKLKDTPQAPKNNSLPKPSKTVGKTPGRKTVGVPVDIGQNGSCVTVLTPVRASRKIQKGFIFVDLFIDLGVDKVITPVRRSLRLLDDTEYVNAHPSISDSKKTPERVAQLLEDHGHAFVPNKVSTFCN
ncbi:hypothetical protein BC833DRAFT_566160 [Globomyces pollinis-pini]|nr:hypothetical protein BC833DRAFT_566160 [Globomyces pollinis-pini]